MAYQLLEVIRKTSVDDDNVDLRLLKDFIKDQRAEDLENSFKRRNDFYRFVQVYNSDNGGKTEVEIISDGEQNNTGFTILKTKEKIAKPLLLNNMHAITKVAPIDMVLDNFKIVNYDEMIYSGYGKFNKFMNVAFYKNDYLYLKAKTNNAINTIENIRLEGIFEDPLQVPGFDEDTSEYPISAKLWNTMLDNIVSRKLRIKLEAVQDEINNATDD